MIKPIAIFCADIHLQHTPPVARSAEPDWYEAMARSLREIQGLVEQHKVPVICAGDIFTNWNSCPELVNFAIRELPLVYAIPGQHDLPEHSMKDIRRSAFWTLIKAGVVEPFWEEPLEVGVSGDVFDLDVDEENEEFLNLHGFPWGKECSNRNIPSREDCPKGITHIAVVHSYIWYGQHKYEGAPADTNFTAYRDRLEGYDVAVFGDNHDGFQAKAGGCTVINCGCVIPRRTQERHYRPSVWLLMDDGTVKRHELDTSKDKWIEEEEPEVVGESEGLTEFLKELKSLDQDSLDFREALRRYTADERVDGDVEAVLKEAIGE